MLKNVLLVGVGSFVGGVLRYLVGVGMRHVSVVFPVGTFLVNLVGCLVIGVVYGLFSKYSTVDNHWCLLLTTGVCGGFTTFSAFANESLMMFNVGAIWHFVIYVLASVVVGILMVALGYLLVR